MQKRKYEIMTSRSGQGRSGGARTSGKTLTRRRTTIWRYDQGRGNPELPTGGAEPSQEESNFNTMCSTLLKASLTVLKGLATPLS